MSKFISGSRSRKNLIGVHPNLVRVVERAIQLTTVDFLVLEGVRSRDQAWINWGKGRTATQCRAAGVPTKYAQPNMSKVTWLRDPLNSKHCLQRDGFGHAVDLAPFPVVWDDLSKFDAIARAMLQAATELKIGVRWGADWDQDGKPRERGETDSPHFEI